MLNLLSTQFFFFNRIYLHNSIFLFKLSFLHYILSTKFCFSFIFFTLFIYVCHQTLHQIDIDSPFSDTIGPQYSAYQGTCCFLHVSFMSSLHSFFFLFKKLWKKNSLPSNLNLIVTYLLYLLQFCLISLFQLSVPVVLDMKNIIYCVML
jgi:hypothetical protein